MADGKNRTIKIKTIYAVLGVLCLGIVMIALNVYQLYHLPWEHALTGFAMPKPKVAWIFSKQVNKHNVRNLNMHKVNSALTCLVKMCIIDHSS